MKKQDQSKYIIGALSALSFTLALTLLLIVAGYDIRIGNKFLVDQDDYNSYSEMKRLYALRTEIDKRYYEDTDSKLLEEGALKGMFLALPDGYSRYFTKEELKEKKQKDKGEFVGIGLSIYRNEEGSYSIKSIEEGGPADQAGLREGDFLLKINGETLTENNFEDLLALIRDDRKKHIFFGSYDSIVLTIDRDGQVQDYSIEKDKIIVRSVHSQRMDDVGYIKIDSFIASSYDDFTKALKDLKRTQIQGLIIDLRDNPGGLVDEALKISGSLLGKEIVYHTKSKDQGIKEYKSPLTKQFDGRIILLVNQNSASASELMTAALKDYNRAEIVGERTFGKGIIQTTYNLPRGDGYKITTKEYLTPKKNSIHKIGIEPDYEVGDVDEQLVLAKEILNNDNK